MKSPIVAAEPELPQSLPIFRAVGGERPLCERELQAQNDTFSGSGGVSQHNHQAGFMPAYKNTLTGEAVISCFADGTPAPVHLLEGLPDAWVASRDEHGCVRRALDSVIAGFLRNGNFFTREAAAQLVAEEPGA